MLLLDDILKEKKGFWRLFCKLITVFYPGVGFLWFFRMIFFENVVILQKMISGQSGSDCCRNGAKYESYRYESN